MEQISTVQMIKLDPPVMVNLLQGAYRTQTNNQEMTLVFVIPRTLISGGLENSYILVFKSHEDLVKHMVNTYYYGSNLPKYVDKLFKQTKTQIDYLYGTVPSLIFATEEDTNDFKQKSFGMLQQLSYAS